MVGYIHQCCRQCTVEPTMLQPVELRGRTAHLVPLQRSHVADLYSAGNHPEIWRYMPCAMESERHMQVWVDAALAAQAQGTELPFVICCAATGKAQGSTRFLDIDLRNHALEIGWTWLAPEMWRTRANTECKYLLLRHAFETLGIVRVQFKTDQRNVQSQRAIERIGALREGVLRKHRLMPDGYWRDSVYFSITDDEWPGVKVRLRAMLEGGQCDR